MSLETATGRNSHIILAAMIIAILGGGMLFAQELKPKKVPTEKSDPYFDAAKQKSRTPAGKKQPTSGSSNKAMQPAGDRTPPNHVRRDPNRNSIIESEKTISKPDLAALAAPVDNRRNQFPRVRNAPSGANPLTPAQLNSDDPPSPTSGRAPLQAPRQNSSFANQKTNLPPQGNLEIVRNPYTTDSISGNPLTPRGTREPVLRTPQRNAPTMIPSQQPQSRNQLQPTSPPPQKSANPSDRNSQFQPDPVSRPEDNSRTSFSLPPTEKPRRLLRKVSGETPVPQENRPQSPVHNQTYQAIEPDSVVSDANLSGENSITRLPEKAGEELFEPGTLMAVVGGEPIFAAHLTLEANQLIEKFMAGAPEKIKQEQRKIVIEKLLNKYVESKLFYVDIIRGLPDGANVKSIFKTLGEHFDKEVLTKILKKNEAKSANEFDIRLRSQGVSLRQFRARWIEDEFVRYFLKDKITIQPDVTHQEIIDYYRKNQETYHRKARARWEQIEVHFTRISNRTEAMKTIAKLGNEVVYGAPLAAVAKRGSHGLKATEGGQEGWVTKGSLVSRKLDEAIFSLPLNRLSDIIETNLGFHIIRVLERSREGAVPFTEAQVEIKKKLAEKKREEAFKKHLAKLRREIPVEIMIKQARTADTGQKTAAMKR